MATVTRPATSLPDPGDDLEAEPIRDYINNVLTFLEGNNIDDANVDFTSTDGIMALRKNQTVTGIKTHTGNIVLSGTATIDLNGIANALILDADADTHISAPTDNQIDIAIGGTDLITLATVGSTFSHPVTVGVDDTGYDVQFFGATASKYFLWDESANKLIIEGDFEVTGTSTGTGLSFANDAPTRIVTGDGSGGLNGEANLTFTGSVLTVTGSGTALDVTGTTDIKGRIQTTTNGAGGNAALNVKAGGTNGDWLVQTGYDIGAGGLRFYDVNATAERMRIHSSGNVSIGTTSEIATVGAESSAAAPTIVRGNSTHASSTGTACFLDFTRAASSAYRMLAAYSGGSADVEFNLRGDGEAFADGSWTGSGADYQEYFESTDASQIEVGLSVVLDGDKVRAYNSGTDNLDDIIGVTRPEADNKNSAVKGNTAWNRWTDKYLTDDWGVYLREDKTIWTYTNDEGKEVSVYEWMELEKDPDWTAPEGAVSSTSSERKLNPAYTGPKLTEDPDYVPRSDREEWNLIGLLGQIQVKAGEATNPRWVKMKDISANVELWYVR